MCAACGLATWGIAKPQAAGLSEVYGGFSVAHCPPSRHNSLMLPDTCPLPAHSLSRGPIPMRPTSLLTLVLLTSSLTAGVPTEPAKRAAIIGAPAALTVEPANLVLTGPRSTRSEERRVGKECRSSLAT